MELDGRLLGELEAMGFPQAIAAKALRSGNSSIEAAINWLVDHENDDDAALTETAMQPEGLVNINIEAFGPFDISEQVKLRAQQLRSQARKKRAEQENKLERESEKERIRAGKELLEAKRMAEESERNRFISQRKADKEEERRAREKIRQKLQQDKLERRVMLGLPREDPTHTNPDTALPQITRHTQPVDSAVLPVKTAEIKDRMRECLRSLKRRNKDDYAKAMKAFQTLFIYVKNIVKNPEEDKFRKIRISNPVFQDRVGKFEEGIEFLELCGFERDEGGEFLFVPREKVDVGLLKSAWIELESALTNPFFGLLSG